MKTLNLQLDDEMAGMLAKCKRQSGFENDGETFACALTFLSRILDCRESGSHQVWCVNEKKNIRTEFDFKFPVDVKKK